MRSRSKLITIIQDYQLYIKIQDLYSNIGYYHRKLYNYLSEY